MNTGDPWAWTEAFGRTDRPDLADDEDVTFPDDPAPAAPLDSWNF